MRIPHYSGLIDFILVLPVQVCDMSVAVETLIELNLLELFVNAQLLVNVFLVDCHENGRAQKSINGEECTRKLGGQAHALRVIDHGEDGQSCEAHGNEIPC